MNIKINITVEEYLLNYYHNNFNIEDDEKIFTKKVDKINLKKIKLAWNFGLADHSFENKYLFLLRKNF